MAHKGDKQQVSGKHYMTSTGRTKEILNLNLESQIFSVEINLRFSRCIQPFAVQRKGKDCPQSTEVEATMVEGFKKVPNLLSSKPRRLFNSRKLSITQNPEKWSLPK